MEIQGIVAPRLRRMVSTVATFHPRWYYELIAA